MIRIKPQSVIKMLLSKVGDPHGNQDREVEPALGTTGEADGLELRGELEKRYANLYMDVRHSRKPINMVCLLV